MTNAIKAYSVWLDGIRGLAALVVFLGHVRVIFIDSIAKAGYAGSAVGASTASAGAGAAMLERVLIPPS